MEGAFYIQIDPSTDVAEKNVEYAHESRLMFFIGEAHLVGPVSHAPGLHHGNMYGVIGRVKVSAAEQELIRFKVSSNPERYGAECQDCDCNNGKPDKFLYVRLIFQGAILV